MAHEILSVPHARSGSRIISSAIAGMIAGVVFAIFAMMMAVVTDGTGAFFMPLRMIGAIGLGTSALDPATSLLTAGGAGTVVHMVLSMMYGVGVALILRVVPSLARTTASVLAASSVAGFLLWVVNFQVLARALGWPWFPDGTNAAVQIVAHTFFFGTVLGLGLIRLRAVRAEA
ncbi:MAG TPA: hypothetical protein VLS28_01280 [Candidatus Sulfomarinibacteraceae bacterium]|nr:hypothetical protein [Candidatus Sulfomarinibacteraceae bacterium]